MTSRSSNSGFTLLEMIVVVTIMGMALLLIIGFNQPHSRHLEIEAAAGKVMEAMQQARGAAIARGTPVAVTLPSLPSWISIIMRAPPKGIVFFPDGSASGGEVLIGGPTRYAVSVDWLTGRVRAHGS